MAQSDTQQIETNSTYVTVESVTNVTFTEGNIYTMQVLNNAYLKIGDAEFQLHNQFMQYKAGSDDLYIKTEGTPCTLVILEEEASE